MQSKRIHIRNISDDLKINIRLNVHLSLTPALSLSLSLSLSPFKRVANLFVDPWAMQSIFRLPDQLCLLSVFPLALSTISTPFILHRVAISASCPSARPSVCPSVGLSCWPVCLVLLEINLWVAIFTFDCGRPQNNDRKLSQRQKNMVARMPDWLAGPVSGSAPRSYTPGCIPKQFHCVVITRLLSDKL